MSIVRREVWLIPGIGNQSTVFQLECIEPTKTTSYQNRLRFNVTKSLGLNIAGVD